MPALLAQPSSPEWKPNNTKTSAGDFPQHWFAWLWFSSDFAAAGLGFDDERAPQKSLTISSHPLQDVLAAGELPWVVHLPQARHRSRNAPARPAGTSRHPGWR